MQGIGQFPQVLRKPLGTMFFQMLGEVFNVGSGAECALDARYKHRSNRGMFARLQSAGQFADHGRR